MVETGESRTPRPKGPLVGCATSLFGDLCLAPRSFHRRNLQHASRSYFGYPLSASKQPHPGCMAPASPSPGPTGSRRSRSYAARANSRSPVIGCHRFNEVDGTSACVPLRDAPVEPARPLALPIIPRRSSMRQIGPSSKGARLVFPSVPEVCGVALLPKLRGFR